jgi:hypothetical protein
MQKHRLMVKTKNSVQDQNPVPSMRRREGYWAVPLEIRVPFW